MSLNILEGARSYITLSKRTIRSKDCFPHLDKIVPFCQKLPQKDVISAMAMIKLTKTI